MLRITPSLSISENEIQISAIRSQGSGGQNVNKVSTAIHLRFDINSSSLNERYKQRLLALNDKRISKDGVINIKAQQFRTQEKNRANAIERLVEMIRDITITRKHRIPIKPSKSSKQKRLDNKARRSKTKSLRGKVSI